MDRRLRISTRKNNDRKSKDGISNQSEPVASDQNDSGRNPLLFDEILRVVAGYLDYETLGTAMLVCSKWNEAMFPSFNRRAKLVMYFPAEEWIQMFVEDVPFQKKNRFKNIQILQPYLLMDPQISAWMSQYADSFEWMFIGLESLTMSEAFKKRNKKQQLSPRYSRHHPYCSSSMFRICEEILMSILFTWCPNLKVLQFSHMDMLGRWTTDGFKYIYVPPPEPILNERYGPVVELKTLDFGSQTQKHLTPFIKSIFGLLASVDTVQMIFYNQSGFIEVLETLKGSPAMNVLEKVKCLDLHSQGLPCDLTTIQTLLSMIEFKNLKGLKLNYIFLSSPNIPAIVSLLELLGTSPFSQLEHLKLDKFNLFGGLVFPKLNQLRTFHVAVDVQNWKDSDMDFLLQLPSLEVLHYRPFFNSLEEDYPSLFQLFGHQTRLAQRQHHKLRELCLREITGTDFELLSNCFPKLESLSFNILDNNQTLTTYLSGVPSLLHLKELEVHHHWTGHMDDFMNAVTETFPQFQALKKFKFVHKGTRDLYTPPIPPVILNSEIFDNGFFRAPSLTSVELDIQNIHMPSQVYDSLVRSFSQTGNKLPRLEFPQGYFRSEKAYTRSTGLGLKLLSRNVIC